MKELGATVISIGVKPNGLNIDYDIEPDWAAKNLKNVALQGGMNPRYLLCPEQEMIAEAKDL